MVKFNCIVLFFICPLIYFAQQVNNVEASQQGQNIVVTYDLKTEQPCTINLFISTNDGNTWEGPLKQVQGQVGSNIKRGKKSITFLVLNELNELRGDNIRFKVDAVANNLNTIKRKKIEPPLKAVEGLRFIDEDGNTIKIAGPACAINSMFFPGWGTTKVSYGKKGSERSKRFFSTLLIAIVSNIYSNKQYDAYLNEKNDLSLMNKYYKSANLSHKVALISGGISATIYLYDVIWVFSKGIKNKKRRIYQ
jgi:hypothetical protein